MSPLPSRAWRMLARLLRGQTGPHILDARVIPSMNHSICAGAIVGVMCLGASLLRQRRGLWIVECALLCAAVGAFEHASKLNAFDSLNRFVRLTLLFEVPLLCATTIILRIVPSNKRPRSSGHMFVWSRPWR